MILKKANGLTLVEVIITAFLFSIILAALFTALQAAQTSWKSGGSRLSVQQETRRGMNTMLKELRQARLSTITGVPADGASYNSITFQIPEGITDDVITWSSNIQYLRGGLNSTQLLKTQDGTQRVLANNISLLTFTRNASAPDIIDISVTAQKETFPGYSTGQTNITLNSELKVRN